MTDEIVSADEDSEAAAAPQVEESNYSGAAIEDDGDTYLAMAADQVQRGDLPVISIRDFIWKWGYYRRGFRAVEIIQAALEENSLITEPPFDEGWMDDDIEIRAAPPRSAATATVTASASSVTIASTTPTDTSSAPVAGARIRVGNLPSARRLITIERTETLEVACAKMWVGDFSQLGVTSGSRRLVGAVTWESIAKANLKEGESSLGGCTIPADVVDSDDDLLAHIPQIIKKGFVFVKSRSGIIEGIITTSDLSEEFLRQTGPFLQVGEIEGLLRRIVAREFTPQEIREARDDRDGDREVDSVDNLSFGEAVRLFEPVRRWDRLGWNFDRRVFLEALHEVRELRNDVMHFSPDPFDDKQLQSLANVLKWLKELV